MNFASLDMRSLLTPELDVIIAGITLILNSGSWLSFLTRVRQNESADFRSWKASRYERRGDSCRDPPHGNHRGEANNYSGTTVKTYML